MMRLPEHEHELGPLQDLEELPRRALSILSVDGLGTCLHLRPGPRTSASQRNSAIERQKELVSGR